MKRRFRTGGALLLTLVLLMSMTVPAMAAESNVTYYGWKDGFGFAPGSQYTATDLFDNFKGVMPGDTLTQTVKITNQAKTCDYIRVYLWAEVHDETENPMSDTVAEANGQSLTKMTDFLKQLTMRVYNGSQLIYESSPDQTAQLTEPVRLGTLSYGKSLNLTVELDVPKTMDNTYAYAVGEVDWVFAVDEWTTPTTPNKPTPEEAEEPKTRLDVEKVWDDDGKNRPTSIEVTLFHGAEPVETVTLSAKNDWRYRWEDLPEGKWSVRETEVPEGYHALYREKDGVTVITNTSDLIKTGQEFGDIAMLGGAGLLLILAAVLLNRNRQEAAQAGEAAQALLEQVQSAVAEQAPAVYETQIVEESAEPVAASEESAEVAPESSAVLPDGYDCIGYLELPKLERTLPVLAQWDYERLKLAPCRQYGSVETGDLVIAAHNYVQHFGSLGLLAAGNAVRFTDLGGAVHEYTVAATAQVAPEQTELVLDSGYPLTLYTCTLGNQSRVVVYCDYAEEAG